MTVVSWPFPPAPPAPVAPAQRLRLEGRIAERTEFAGWHYRVFLDHEQRPQLLPHGGAVLVFAWPAYLPGRPVPVRTLFAPSDWLQFDPPEAA